MVYWDLVAKLKIKNIPIYSVYKQVQCAGLFWVCFNAHLMVKLCLYMKIPYTFTVSFISFSFMLRFCLCLVNFLTHSFIDSFLVRGNVCYNQGKVREKNNFLKVRKHVTQRILHLVIIRYSTGPSCSKVV